MKKKIAIIGVGSVGSLYAYQLARAGHDVTVIARPGSARLEQLQRDGAIVREAGERAPVSVASELDEQAAFDLVLVTTLAHQVDALLPALQRSNAQCVQFMFNNFDPERLRDALGAERCSFGLPFVMASLDQHGKLHAKIGAGQKTLHGQQCWVELFAAAGIPSSYEPEMMLWLRCHAPLCIAFESIAVAGQRRGGGASWAEAVTVARGLQSGFAVLASLGYRVYPSAKSLLAHAPLLFMAAMLWSMSRITSFRELLATGANECRALVDTIIFAAEKAKAPLLAEIAALRVMKPAS
jgi:2-dehydropantoate 2-reductase